MNNKYFILFIIGLVIAVPSATVAALSASTPTKTLTPHPNIEGISIAIAPEYQSLSAGEAVYIDVNLTNNRATSLILPEPHEPEQMLSLTVHRINGAPVHLTDFGAATYFKPNYARHITMQQYTGVNDPWPGLTVQPGKSLHFKILLSRLYDLSKEGIYFVNVSQWVPKIDGTGYATIVSAPSEVQIPGASNQSLTPETTNPSDPGHTVNEWPVGSQF